MFVIGVSETTRKATTLSSMCHIEFVHPGVIDIASLQHVVAYVGGGSVLINSPQRWREELADFCIGGS
jgi:hypothetical protein